MKPNEFFKKRFGIMEESKNDEKLMSNLISCIAEDCGGCPYKTDACKTGLLMDVNNLIERQQAEIERNKKIIQDHETIIEMLEKEFKTTKSETVREFAEKLKSMLSFGRYTSYEQIDNLVKEMTEDKENV